MEWVEFKDGIVAATGLSRDMLHLLFGFGLFALIALLLRCSARNPLPWLSVFALCFANEALDLMASSALKSYLDWGASLHDFSFTMLLPTMIMVGSCARQLLPAPRTRRNAKWRRARERARPCPAAR